MARFDLFVDRILIPALSLKIFISAIVRHEDPLSSAVGFATNYVLPVLMLFLLLIARPAARSKISFSASVGLLLSFGGFWFFRWSAALPPRGIAVIGIANALFYTGMAIYAYVSIGRSFGVVPAVRKTISRGPFQFVRHPIYACFLHLALNFMLFCRTPRNVACVLAIALGLYLRLAAEEELLRSEASYQAYRCKTPRRLFSVWFSAPIAVLALALAGHAAVKYEARQAIGHAKTLTVQIGFPITSTNPVIYDDWSSVFLGNHIYYRLFKEPTRPSIPAITDEIRLRCVENPNEQNLDHCSNIEIRFVVKSFKDCLGRAFDSKVATREFETIIREKTWILPGWKTCKPSVEDELCYTVPRVSDLKRRLRNLYFRFGWSLALDSDSILGAGPYCFTQIERDNTGVIRKGLLVPRADNAQQQLVPILIVTSIRTDTAFDVALYGTKELAAGKRINVQTQTPLAYYVVTNEKYAKYRLPWNTPGARITIAKHMAAMDMLYSVPTNLMELLPPGAAIERAHDNPHYSGKTPVELILPDYLPSCPQLAKALSDQWSNAHENAMATCGNTSQLTENYTKHGFKDWFAMMSPLSPGAPGRNAIQYQYFSPFSKESWTGTAKDAEALYYIVGIGQSLATVDNENICGLQPNSMGLGDVFVTDFISCGL